MRRSWSPLRHVARWVFPAIGFERAPSGALSRVHAELASPGMSRPTRFEDFRFLGDKRKQVVYDLDSDDPESQVTRRRAPGVGAVRGLRPRHARRGTQPRATGRSDRPPTRAEPGQATGASVGRASRMPLSRPSNATSDSASSLGTDAGSSGSPSRSTQLRAAAVGVAPGHRDGLEEPVHAEHEHPQRVAALPAQA